METAFGIITLMLGVAMVLTMVGIVREVSPQMSEDDQAALRVIGSRISLRSDRAIGRAWGLHRHLFPRSHKRVLFACLLIATLLSAMGYPLWLALGPRG